MAAAAGDLESSVVYLRTNSLCLRTLSIKHFGDHDKLNHSAEKQCQERLAAYREIRVCQ
jgi:hypothetical protein